MPNQAEQSIEMGQEQSRIAQFIDYARAHTRELMFAAALPLAAIGATACAGSEVEAGSPGTTGTTTAPVESSTTSTTEALTTCENYGEVVHVSAGETHRLIGDGVPSIGTAKTPEEAREAAGDYYSLISTDPELLAGGYNVLVATDDETKLVGADLIGEDGCFNDRGATVAAEVYTTLYTAKIVPDQAPADGTNSGTNDAGDVVFAEAPGISGNRKAILVTAEDGRETWILERCGNYVTRKPVPGVPKGPTDEPEPTPDKTPRPLEGVMPHPQPGAGGEQGSPNEPDCDSDNDGYCDGQPRPTVPESGTTTTTTVGETTPTTGPPREEDDPTPVTTVVKPPNDTKPPKPSN